MGRPRFMRPKGEDGKSTPNLFVANCGPAVGISYDSIASVFGTFGEVKGVNGADESGARVIISYSEASSAEAALKAMDGRPCPDLGGRSLHIRFSIAQPSCLGPTHDLVPVSLMASELNVPGLYLLHDFVNVEEEKELLAAVDDRPWINLSKRRVQHYGQGMLIRSSTWVNFPHLFLQYLKGYPCLRMLTVLQVQLWIN